MTRGRIRTRPTSVTIRYTVVEILIPTEQGRQAGVQGIINQSDRKADEAHEPDEQHDHDRVVAEKGEVRVRPLDERRYSEGYRSDRRHERMPMPGIHEADDHPDRSGHKAHAKAERDQGHRPVEADVPDHLAVLRRETNGVLVEDRRQPHDQPAAESRDKIPTTTPAIPPRATSRRISPAGETAGRLSKVVGGAPVVTSGSAMARSDVVIRAQACPTCRRGLCRSTSCNTRGDRSVARTARRPDPRRPRTPPHGTRAALRCCGLAWPRRDTTGSAADR